VSRGGENNWLINPQHPEFRKIALHAPEPLRYDPRMFRRGRRQNRSMVLRAGRFLAPQRQKVLRPLDGRRNLLQQFLQILIALHEVNLGSIHDQQV
jgi:hypothetical protein